MTQPDTPAGPAAPGDRAARADGSQDGPVNGSLSGSVNGPVGATAGADGGGAWAHNARVGLVLFFVYLALYAGFIALAAFGKDVMARPSLGGVNVGVLYGFLLIAAAFLLALLYMALCRPEPPGPAADLTEGEISDKALSEEGSA